jgi:hypothetical protein
LNKRHGISQVWKPSKLEYVDNDEKAEPLKLQMEQRRSGFIVTHFLRLKTS